MFFADLVFAFIIALLLTWIFGIGVSRHEFGGPLIVFFVILFFTTWAGGIWVAPVGPVVWGMSWLPFIVVGLVFALLLTAIVPPYNTRRHRNTYGGKYEEAASNEAKFEKDTSSELIIDSFFWVFILGLLITITISYIW